MKKVLAVLFVVALMGVTFTSCKKECTCKESKSGYVDNTRGKVSKKDCSDWEDGLNKEGSAYGQSWSCSQ